MELLKSADRIVAMSEDEAMRLKHFGAESERISVVNCPIEPPVAADSLLLRELRDRFNLPRQFALTIGNYGAERKNIQRLAEAAVQTNTPLVIGGWASPGPTKDRILAMSAETSLISIATELDDDECNGLMELASVYCQPSLTEGAGMAAIEAAARGCSVITTIHGGADEHLGGLATAVDPFDERAIEGALSALLVAPQQAGLRDFVLAHRLLAPTGGRLVDVYQRAIRRRNASTRRSDRRRL